MPLVHEDPELAERSSLLGRAQRGQGGAFRELLEVEASRAAEVVVACAIRDPRPDRQLDTRAGYYGALIARRGLAIEPIVRHLREEPAAGARGEIERELAADVLPHTLVRHLRIPRELLRDSAYDYLRNRCVTALLELDPGYASSRELEDALWDASPEVLDTAARATPLTPTARGRLAELAADALEDEDARAAARERLAPGP